MDFTFTYKRVSATWHVAMVTRSDGRRGMVFGGTRDAMIASLVEFVARASHD